MEGSYVGDQRAVKNRPQNKRSAYTCAMRSRLVTFHVLGNCVTSPSCTFLTKKSLKMYQGDCSGISESLSEITI